MAISSVAKNFRDGTIVFQDATTPTALDLTVQYENGDFSISGLMQAQTAVTQYLDRGVFYSARKTNQNFPQFSFTAHFTDLADGTEETLYNLVDKSGAFASAVSTLGANADVMTYNVSFTVEGTDHGDAADHVLTMNDVHLTIDIAEGDPSTFTITGTVHGTISAT
jgi:hypothetical protein